MSSTYAGDPTNYPISITIPGDGDEVSAASVNPAFEGLKDGLAFLAATRTPLADLMALAAITTPADGLVRHVLGQGFYVFKTSATAGLSPFRVAAGDATAGGWVASCAHETTLTLYVSGNRIAYITTAACAPALATLACGFVPTGKASFPPINAGCSAILGESSTDVTNAWGYLIPLGPGDLVDGATLSSAVLKYTPDDSSAPGSFLQYTIIRSAKTGIDPTSAAMISTGGGFVADAGTYASGTTKSVTYTTNQNNVIDQATYSYAIVIFDEHGTSGSSGNTVHEVALSYASIPDARR